MQKLIISIFYLSTLTSLYAKDLPKTSEDSFRYSVDSQFLWADSLAIPTFGLKPQNTKRIQLTQSPNFPPSGVRGLGLNYLKIQTYWQNPNGMGFAFFFRPDATLVRTPDGKTNQGYDLRAGTPYRPEQAIYLLDQYVLRWSRSDSLKFSLGIIESLTYEITPLYFPKFIEFGLNVRMPEKFLALGVQHNRTSNPLVDTQDRIVEKDRFTYEVFIFQGRNERMETLVPNSKSNAYSNWSQNTALSVAVRSELQFKSRVSFCGLIGYGEENVASTLSTSQTQKVNEFFAQLYSQNHFHLYFPLSSGLDVRYAKENWQKDSDANPPLTQFSSAIFLSADILKTLRFQFKFSSGTSDRSEGTNNRKKTTQNGYEMDFGMYYHNFEKSNLTFGLVLAQEHRKQRNGQGAEYGAFGFPDHWRSDIQRIAAGITYSLQGNS